MSSQSTKRTTHSPKPSGSTARVGGSAANRAAQVTLTAVESTRYSTESAVKAGTEAVREFLATGADEAQKAQEKAFAFGRESAETFARSADAATQGINEMISVGRENMEACVECGNIATNMAKELSAELVQYANNAFSEQAEISKELFTCRTVNDVFELQSKLVRSTLDNFFNESAKFSELFFRYASEITEPLNERFADATERLSRSLAA